MDELVAVIENPAEGTPMKLVCGGGLLNKASMESLEAGIDFGCDGGGGFEGVGVMKSNTDGGGWDDTCTGVPCCPGK